MLHRGNPPQRGRDDLARVQGREAAAALFNALSVAKQRHSIAPEASPRFVVCEIHPTVGGWKPPLLGLRRITPS